MNDPYDDEENDYEDDQYDYDNNQDPYKYYFKFNMDQITPLSDWISKLISDIFSKDFDKPTKFPVNSWNSNTAGKNMPQYLGSNYYKEPIWKSKYFAYNPFDTEYKFHLQSNAAYFLQQPKYYKGLFEILN
jgi:hypothetical protein